MSDIEHLFMYSFSHLYIFFGEMSVLLAHFLIGSFVFLVLSCMSCLYILEINSLLVVSFVGKSIFNLLWQIEMLYVLDARKGHLLIVSFCIIVI